MIATSEIRSALDLRACSDPHGISYLGRLSENQQEEHSRISTSPFTNGLSFGHALDHTCSNRSASFL